MEVYSGAHVFEGLKDSALDRPLAKIGVVDCAVVLAARLVFMVTLPHEIQGELSYPVLPPPGTARPPCRHARHRANRHAGPGRAPQGFGSPLSFLPSRRRRRSPRLHTARRWHRHQYLCPDPRPDSLHLVGRHAFRRHGELKPAQAGEDGIPLSWRYLQLNFSIYTPSNARIRTDCPKHRSAASAGGVVPLLGSFHPFNFADRGFSGDNSERLA